MNLFYDFDGNTIDIQSVIAAFESNNAERPMLGGVCDTLTATGGRGPTHGQDAHNVGRQGPKRPSMTEEERKKEIAALDEEVEQERLAKNKEQSEQAQRLHDIGIQKDPDTSEEDWQNINKFAFDYIAPSDNIPLPTYSLSFNAVKFAPLNNLFAIGAHKKGGKTTAISILIAALFGHKDFGLSACNNGPQPVLYFDTEQDKADTYTMWSRVAHLCRWDAKKGNPDFRIINLRLYSKAVRLECILASIHVLRPKHVFIDGIKDICPDFNSQEDSTELI